MFENGHLAVFVTKRLSLQYCCIQVTINKNNTRSFKIKQCTGSLITYLVVPLVEILFQEASISLPRRPATRLQFLYYCGSLSVVEHLGNPATRLLRTLIKTSIIYFIINFLLHVEHACQLCLVKFSLLMLTGSQTFLKITDINSATY